MSVLLEISLPSRDARASSSIGCILYGTDRRGVTLLRRDEARAAREVLKVVPARNRDVPGGRDSDFREERTGSPLFG